MIEDKDIEKALDYIRDKANLIGSLRGQKAYLEHRIKIQRSQCFLNADGTVAEREAIGYTDPSVYELVNEYRDCVTELETIATLVKAADLKIEVWRTQQANNRRGNV